jgi:FixJ family two-component response regulator
MMSHRADRQATVFVIDDDTSVRESLAELFASMGLRAETFGSVAEFLATEISETPSCLVLDVRLPGLSGLDFQADLARAGIPMPIIFITGHGDIPMSVKAMKAGAVEFLTKPFRDQELLDAVQRGLELDRTRREQQKSVTELRARFDSLTPREQEVIRFVCDGLMNKQIGGELGVSEITVKVHRGNAMRKMGAKSLADLLRMAQVLGLDRPK